MAEGRGLPSPRTRDPCNSRSTRYMLWESWLNYPEIRAFPTGPNSFVPPRVSVCEHDRRDYAPSRKKDRNKLAHSVTPSRWKLIGLSVPGARIAGSPSLVALAINVAHASAAISRTNPSKQRVVVSTQYEKKLDDIVKGIDSIRGILQRLDPGPPSQQLARADQLLATKDVPEEQFQPVEDELSLQEHAIQVESFVKEIVENSGSQSMSIETAEVLLSLKKLLRQKYHSKLPKVLPIPSLASSLTENSPSMPAMEVSLRVLRWVEGTRSLVPRCWKKSLKPPDKDHKTNYMMVWLSWILPMERFTEICQRVCFAVDEYTSLDYIITNGFLSWMFGEYYTLFGDEIYRTHCIACGENLQHAVSKLSLLLPPSKDTVVALTVGVGTRAKCNMESES
ncbi:hypothetical protein BX600DRAFT_443289 [Xylariales sp. PMI_506]|nr:hypothetical protein BX600DRAFT_443289 [Xylariales sp. PMI_506]